MFAQAPIDRSLTQRWHGLMRSLAVVLAFALFTAPMVQSNVTSAMVEECGSKPPPIIEEEVHKSIPSAATTLPAAPSLGIDHRADAGPAELPSPARDVISPPPDLC